MYWSVMHKNPKFPKYFMIFSIVVVIREVSDELHMSNSKQTKLFQLCEIGVGSYHRLVGLVLIPETRLLTKHTYLNTLCA